MKPLIVVNFKAYKEGFGSDGVKLATLLSEHDNVIMCVPAPLIGVTAGLHISDNSCVKKAEVFAQHVDPDLPGAHTGSVTVEEIKAAGAAGSLLNHSEKRLPFNVIKETVKRLKDNNLKVIVCCQDLDEAVKFSKLEPDFIAFEPPELIGGDVSVTTRPESIKRIVEAVKPVKVLVGAGVKSRSDILKSVELGAHGVLIASGLIKAVDKEAKVKELVVYEDSQG